MDQYINFDVFEEFNEIIKKPLPFTEIDKNLCEHFDTLNESGTILCSDCGLELCKIISYEKDWRYYGSDDTRQNSDPNRCHIRKVEDKSIFKDVEPFGFSDKIVNLANEIYGQVTKGKIYRGNSRKSVVFGCMFNAIKINGKPLSCESLREIFNLDRKIVLRGLKTVNLSAPKGSEIRTKYITPVELIGEYSNSIFNISDTEKMEMIQLYEKIKNKSSIINRSRPQSIASSLIYYHLSKKENNTISLKEFIKKVKLSELTIIKICKEVDRVLK